MKEQNTISKYGFSLDEFERKNKLDRHVLYIYYVSENLDKCFGFTHEFKSKGIFKTLSEYKKLENQFRNSNICQCIAFIINSSRYGWMRRFYDEEFESDILDDIPDSLILNDKAMQELLSNLNQENKHLVVYVAEYVKNRKKGIEENKQLDFNTNKETYEKYEAIKQEFGF